MPSSKKNSHGWIHRGQAPIGDLRLFQASWQLWQNPRNLLIERMLLLHGGDAVNVVARTPAGTIVFVEQFRFGTAQLTQELPGGLIDEGETILQAAQRELREETGYTAKHWTPLGRIAFNPAFMDAHLYYYFADSAVFTHEQELDRGEDIRIIHLPEKDVYEKWLAGAFVHPHSMQALQRYYAHNRMIGPPPLD